MHSIEIISALVKNLMTLVDDSYFYCNYYRLRIIALLFALSGSLVTILVTRLRKRAKSFLHVQGISRTHWTKEEIRLSDQDHKQLNNLRLIDRISRDTQWSELNEVYKYYKTIEDNIAEFKTHINSLDSFKSDSEFYFTLSDIMDNPIFQEYFIIFLKKKYADEFNTDDILAEDIWEVEDSSKSVYLKKENHTIKGRPITITSITIEFAKNTSKWYFDNSDMAQEKAQIFLKNLFLENFDIVKGILLEFNRVVNEDADFLRTDLTTEIKKILQGKSRYQILVNVTNFTDESIVLYPYPKLLITYKGKTKIIQAYLGLPVWENDVNLKDIKEQDRPVLIKPNAAQDIVVIPSQNQSELAKHEGLQEFVESLSLTDRYERQEEKSTNKHLFIQNLMKKPKPGTPTFSIRFTTLRPEISQEKEITSRKYTFQEYPHLIKK